MVSAPPASSVSAPPALPPRRPTLADQLPRRRGLTQPPAHQEPSASPISPGLGSHAAYDRPGQEQPTGYGQQAPYDGFQAGKVAGYDPFSVTTTPPAPAPTSGSPTASFPDSPHFGTESRDYGAPLTQYGPGPSAPHLDLNIAPPGSRVEWPLRGDTSSDLATAVHQEPSYGASPLDQGGDHQRPSEDLPRQREGRVVPPWQSDDLPAEPPTLRLVESARPAPVPPAERPYSSPLGDLREPPALRLVDSDRGTERPSRSSRRAAAAARVERVEPPVAVDTDSDGDLLIFAAARSAWFTDPVEETDLTWATAADAGWEAAQHAARPAVGSDTRSGLPRRVPQQNLVPGSATAVQERPLRIVRDAAAIAAHTTGYFQGWRRGQEVGGFAVGGRPGRESAGGWDFTREPGRDQTGEYEYRQARR
jgi:hypothetical protein